MMIILLNQNIVHGQPSEKKDVFPILIIDTWYSYTAWFNTGYVNAGRDFGGRWTKNGQSQSSSFTLVPRLGLALVGGGGGVTIKNK